MAKARNNDEVKVAPNDEVKTTGNEDTVPVPEIKKFKILLPVIRGQKDQSVFVGVNDETFLIKRGVEVEVPYYVADLIRNSEKALNEADAYIVSASTD